MAIDYGIKIGKLLRDMADPTGQVNTEKVQKWERPDRKDFVRARKGLAQQWQVERDEEGLASDFDGINSKTVIKQAAKDALLDPLASAVNPLSKFGGDLSIFLLGPKILAFMTLKLLDWALLKSMEDDIKKMQRLAEDVKTPELQKEMSSIIGSKGGATPPSNRVSLGGSGQSSSKDNDMRTEAENRAIEDPEAAQAR